MPPQILLPDKYKPLLLAFLLVGSISTIFLPYNSFHNGSPSLQIKRTPAINDYCASTQAKYRKNCGSINMYIGGNKNENKNEKSSEIKEECQLLSEDIEDCQAALASAFRRINLSGCLKYYIQRQMCMDECDDDSSSTSQDYGGGVGSNSCSKKCGAKESLLADCQSKIVDKEMKRYGLDIANAKIES
mmetsp:Transcript_1331/g.2390  ORF Transcript_1331/g.2390 Transcript_1331/m.2390 type:complete len:188 (-) Transcript_1331:1310-1873(-)